MLLYDTYSVLPFDYNLNLYRETYITAGADPGGVDGVASHPPWIKLYITACKLSINSSY